RTALRAVDKMLVRIGGERLLEVPQMEPVRRALLEEALAFYQEFLRERGTDPRVRADAARGYRWVGSIERWPGHSGPAEENLRPAIGLYRGLDEESPDPRFRYHIAGCQFDRGYLFAEQGRFREAEEDYREAIRGWEAVEADLPERASPRFHLANTLNLLTLLLWESARHAEAEQTARRALALWGKLGDGAASRCGQAVGLFNLSLVLRNTSFGQPRRMREAEDCQERSVVMLEKLVDQQPRNPFYRWKLGMSLNGRGNLLQGAKRNDEAEKA